MKICLAVVAVLLVAVCALSVETKEEKKCYQTISQRRYVPSYLYLWGRIILIYRLKYVTRKVVVPCPVDCQWGPWDGNEEDWSSCSVSCGFGISERLERREKVVKAAHGGKDCRGPSTRVIQRQCDMLDCPHTICEKATDVNGYHAHLQMCYSFIQCENRKAHVHDCPEGTSWDSKGEKHCSKDALHSCENTVCDSGMILPHETDCKKYYKCDHNRLHEGACPLETPYWDFVSMHCNSDESVCKGRDPDEDDEPDLCSGDALFVPMKDDPSQYYMCVHGDPVAMKCPEKLLFDADALVCVWAQ